MELPDTHCHLTDEAYERDVDEVLRRARLAGVTGFITVGTDPKEWQSTIELAERERDVFCSLAVHPHDAERYVGGSDRVLAKLIELARSPKVVAVGETGLDFHYLNSPAKAQIEMFTKHLEIARKLSLPLIIHCRKAFEELFSILKDFEDLRGVFHCFSGGRGELERAVGRGFFISFAGVITFRNAKRAVEMLKAVPENRVLLETDCPYLAPQPHRGKRNEPAYIVEILSKASEVRSIAPEELAKVVSQNCLHLFQPGILCTAYKEEQK